MKTRTVGIIIFPDAEVLDYAGPFEAFNVANTVSGQEHFRVIIIAEEKKVIDTRYQMKVVPDFSIDDHPELDLLLIPGGRGRVNEMENERLRQWIQRQFDKIELLLSVCTGAFIVGKAGLLRNLKATTHHRSYNEFEDTFPDTKLIREARFVENEKVITSGGISAGIDMVLHVIEKFHGRELTVAVAKRMEYNFQN